MRLVVTDFSIVRSISLLAQDPAQLPEGPVKLPWPTTEFWKQDTLSWPVDSVLTDTIPLFLPSSALTDSMLWCYLYLEEEQERSSLTIIGTGDIMLGTSYPSESYLPPGKDCSPILRPVHEVLQSGDLLFGNMEGVFCSEGGTPKKCKDLTKCYVFRMPDHFLNIWQTRQYQPNG